MKVPFFVRLSLHTFVLMRLDRSVWANVPLSLNFLLIFPLVFFLFTLFSTAHLLLLLLLLLLPCSIFKHNHNISSTF